MRRRVKKAEKLASLVGRISNDVGVQEVSVRVGKGVSAALSITNSTYPNPFFSPVPVCAAMRTSATRTCASSSCCA